MTGEEIITQAINSREHYSAKEPYLIVKDYRAESTLYQLDRWMPYAETSSFLIDKKHVITYNEPTKALYDFYEHVKKIENEPDVTTHYHTGQVH